MIQGIHGTSDEWSSKTSHISISSVNASTLTPVYKAAALVFLVGLFYFLGYFAEYLERDCCDAFPDVRTMGKLYVLYVLVITLFIILLGIIKMFLLAPLFESDSDFSHEPVINFRMYTLLYLQACIPGPPFITIIKKRTQHLSISSCMRFIFRQFPYILWFFMIHLLDQLIVHEYFHVSLIVAHYSLWFGYHYEDMQTWMQKHICKCNSKFCTLFHMALYHDVQFFCGHYAECKVILIFDDHYLCLDSYTSKKNGHLLCLDNLKHAVHILENVKQKKCIVNMDHTPCAKIVAKSQILLQKFCINLYTAIICTPSKCLRKLTDEEADGILHFLHAKQGQSVLLNVVNRANQETIVTAMYNSHEVKCPDPSQPRNRNHAEKLLCLDKLDLIDIIQQECTVPTNLEFQMFMNNSPCKLCSRDLKIFLEELSKELFHESIKIGVRYIWPYGLEMDKKGLIKMISHSPDSTDIVSIADFSWVQFYDALCLYISNICSYPASISAMFDALSEEEQSEIIVRYLYQKTLNRAVKLRMKVTKETQKWNIDNIYNRPHVSDQSDESLTQIAQVTKAKTKPSNKKKCDICGNSEKDYFVTCAICKNVAHYKCAHDGKQYVCTNCM